MTGAPRSGRIALAAVIVTAVGAPSARSAVVPKVDLMVVGRSAVLFAPRTVALPAFSLRVAGRSCAVGPGTPLGALQGARRLGGPALRLRDYGSCSRRAADAGGLFVTQIGPDRNAGPNGWVYKVGRRVGTAGAGDLTGPFGTGRRLRTGDRVAWFYCRMTSTATCQRTLEVRLTARRLAPGAALGITVTGYDDNGRGRPVAGAVVGFGPAGGRTDASGETTLTAPSAPGAYRVTAARTGLIPAFGEAVTVG